MGTKKAGTAGKATTPAGQAGKVGRDPVVPAKKPAHKRPTKTTGR